MTFFTDEMLAEKKENKILNTEKQIRELKKQVKTLQAKIDEFESTTQSTIGQYSINQDMTEITINVWIEKPELVASLIGNSRNGNED